MGVSSSVISDILVAQNPVARISPTKRACSSLIFASFATFELLARPALAKLQGADPAPVRVRAALANGFGKPSPLRRFVRATLMGGVVTLPKGGHFSGGIGALAGCNCLVDVPAGSRALNAGDEVEVILL